MWRYLIGAVAALALAGGGVMLFGRDAGPKPLLAAAPASQAGAGQSDPLPEAAPAATEKTREEKRFGRYDKDRDGTVTREEYLAQRRKAFAKLDSDHDGRLSFDEWAVKATTKFAAADADRSGAMTPVEFAKTAVKRKTPVRAKCPPAQGSEES